MLTEGLDVCIVRSYDVDVLDVLIDVFTNTLQTKRQNVQILSDDRDDDVNGCR